MGTTAVERLKELVEDERVADLVEAHYSGTALTMDFAHLHHPTSEAGFAGSTFLDLKPNHPFAIGSEDLLAVSLMDVSFGPTAVRMLLMDPIYQKRVSKLLVEIPDDVPLWEADDLTAAHALWDIIRELPQVDYVKAGKLLARKRPHLIPVVDSVVERVVDAPHGEYWSTFREYLRMPEAVRMVVRLGPSGACEGFPILRSLDAAIWMAGSNGGSVRRVRQAVLGDPEPLFPARNDVDVDEVAASPPHGGES